MTQSPFWQSLDAFKDAVSQATVAAEEAVAGVHRRRLVTWAAVIAFIAASAVNIPVSAVISRENAHANCVLISELAGLGTKRLSLEHMQTGHAHSKVRVLEARTKRFEHESADRLGLTRKQFQQLVGEQRAEAALQDREANEASVEQRERKRILNRIAYHSCG